MACMDMFSIRAVDNLSTRHGHDGVHVQYARGWLIGAVRRGLARKALVVSISRFTLVAYLAILSLMAIVYIAWDPLLVARVAVYGAAFSVLWAIMLSLHVGLLRDEDGNARRSLGLANRFTILRFVLVLPLVLLVLEARYPMAVVAYAVCLATDIADGIVARRKERPTEFGAVMDPLADIVSTAGLYGALLAQDLIPAWVFAILVARYSTLFAGCVILFLSPNPPRIRATTVGKIVGVLQGVAGIMILILAATGTEWQETVGVALFPFLGMVFGTVIVSQLLIGYRHLARGSSRAGSPG